MSNPTNIPVCIQLEGHYKLSVKRADGSERCSFDFPNLIVDNGLDLFAETPTQAFGIRHMFTWCGVGTGTTAPAVTDSALETQIADVAYYNGDRMATSTFVEAAGAVPAYWRAVATYRFTTGVAEGNLSEIAIGHAAANIFSRALITDSGGTPVTITVLADEVLDVTYELRSYINKTDQAIAFDISGVSHTGTLRSYNIDSAPSMKRALDPTTILYAYEAGLPATLYLTTSGSYGEGVMSASSYTTGNYYQDFSAFYDLTVANFASYINSFVYNQQFFCSFAFSVSPAIQKVDYKKLTMNFRLSWARYTPP